MWNICRTCMNKKVEMIWIFDQKKSPSINDMIMTISTLEFLPNDTLPSEICMTCFETLEMTYYFKEQIVRCNKALQKQARKSTLLARCKMLAHQQEENEMRDEESQEDYLGNSRKFIFMNNSSNKTWNICRTCRAKEVEMISIFDQAKSPSIYEMIMTVSSLEFLPNEALPSEICITCFETLEITYYFKEQVIRCNNAIQKQLQRMKLLGRCKMLALQSENEDEAEKMEEEELVSIVESDDELPTELSTVVFNIDDHSTQCHNPLSDKPSPECDVNTLNLELPLTIGRDNNDLTEHCASAGLNDDNSHLDESCIKSEKVDVEEHGMQVGGSWQKTPKQFMPNDNKGISSEEDLPLTELHRMNEIYIPQDAQQTSNEMSEETTEVFKGIKRSRDVENLSSDKRNQGYKCEVCGKTLEKRSKLTTHMRSHTGERPYECKQCHSKHSTNGNLNAHIRRYHTIGDTPKLHDHQCEICGKTFVTRSALEIHMRSHTGERPFKCQYCNMGFTQHGNLKLHVKRKHRSEGDAKSDKCENGGETLEAPGDLEIQMERFSGERPFKCQQCDASFKHHGTFSRHVRLHTEKVAKPYTCELCGKAFEKPNYLKIHMRSHTGERPYECQQCDAKYASIGARIVHVRRKHTAGGQPKPHQCEVCGLAHESLCDLKIHMRYHTGERPFKCQHCNAAFVRRSQLNKHNRVHSGESIPKPHRCEVCEKTFETPSWLKQHMTNHTDERPFKCDHCNASFKLTKHLSRHVLTHVDKDTTKGTA